MLKKLIIMKIFCIDINGLEIKIREQYYGFAVAVIAALAVFGLLFFILSWMYNHPMSLTSGN